jgi:hypothetical protein
MTLTLSWTCAPSPASSRLAGLEQCYNIGTSCSRSRPELSGEPRVCMFLCADRWSSFMHPRPIVRVCRHAAAVRAPVLPNPRGAEGIVLVAQHRQQSSIVISAAAEARKEHLDVDGHASALNAVWPVRPAYSSTIEAARRVRQTARGSGSTLPIVRRQVHWHWRSCPHERTPSGTRGTRRARPRISAPCSPLSPSCSSRERAPGPPVSCYVLHDHLPP